MRKFLFFKNNIIHFRFINNFFFINNRNSRRIKKFINSPLIFWIFKTTFFRSFNFSKFFSLFNFFQFFSYKVLVRKIYFHTRFLEKNKSYFVSYIYISAFVDFMEAFIFDFYIFARKFAFYITKIFKLDLFFDTKYFASLNNNIFFLKISFFNCRFLSVDDMFLNVFFFFNSSSCRSTEAIHSSLLASIDGNLLFSFFTNLLLDEKA